MSVLVSRRGLVSAAAGILLLACLLTSRNGLADWMNLTGAETAPTIAEIFVERDRVRLLLEISLDDLTVFEDLVPDDWLSEAAAQR